MKVIIDPGHGGYDPGGGSNQYFKEKDINLLISKYQDIIEQGSKTLGYSEQYLDKKTIGELVSRYITGKYGVLGAFVNSSGVRATLPSGNITKANCYEVFPFDNIVYIVKLKGDKAKRALSSSSNYSYQDPDQTIILTKDYYIAVIDFLYTRDSNEFTFRDSTFYNTNTLMRDDFIDCCRVLFS